MAKFKHFSVLCPFCKEVLTFELEEEDLKKRYEGGLAGVILPPHGKPAHSLEIYIDAQGLIRGAYPRIEEQTSKEDLQNYYITDATCEITCNEGIAMGVKIIPYKISIENGPYKAYNEEIFFSDVYEEMLAQKRIRSIPIEANTFIDVFNKAPKGKNIIAIILGKRFSKNYENALEAKQAIAINEPERAESIYVINTQTVGPLVRLMIQNILKMDEAGKPLDEILDYLSWVSAKHISYFYVDSLEVLRRSERLGPVTTFFGNLLGRRPIIVENPKGKGELDGFKNVGGIDDAITEITKTIKKDYEGQDLEGVVFYGINIDQALKLQEELIKEVSSITDKFELDYIGTGVAINLSYDVLGVSLYPKKKK